MSEYLRAGPRDLSEGRYQSGDLGGSDNESEDDLEPRLENLREKRDAMRRQLKLIKDSKEQYRVHRRLELIDDDIRTIEKELQDARQSTAPSNHHPRGQMRSSPIEDPPKINGLEGDAARAQHLENLRAATAQRNIPSSRDEDDIRRRAIERMKQKEKERRADPGFTRNWREPYSEPCVDTEQLQVHESMEQDDIVETREEKTRRKQGNKSAENKPGPRSGQLDPHNGDVKLPPTSSRLPVHGAKRPRQRGENSDERNNALQPFEDSDSSNSNSGVIRGRVYVPSHRTKHGPFIEEDEPIHEHPRTRQPAVDRPLFYKVCAV